jgi:hypothetical protein
MQNGNNDGQQQGAEKKKPKISAADLKKFTEFVKEFGALNTALTATPKNPPTGTPEATP